jgi:AraC-like DNA-binding protein
VFRAEGLPIWLAHDQSGQVPLRSMMSLFERSARELGDDMFGLNLGLAMQPEDYGLVGRYIGSASTLSGMIQRSVRAVPIHTSGSAFSLQVRNGLAYWEFRAFDPFNVGRRHHVDHVVPSVVRSLFRFFGTRWTPLRLEFEYDRPARWQIIEDWVGAPVIFGAPTNAVVFDAQLMESAPKRQLPVKDALTWGDLRRFFMQKPPATKVDAARQVIRIRLMDGAVDIDGTARLLGIGARTLQRQLAEENLTFRDLLTQQRMQRAADLLRESSEPITSIAFSLGYADVASFSRAFKQLTGKRPSDYRQPLSEE